MSDSPECRDATPDEAHDIGYSKGHIDGYREGLLALTPPAEGREALADLLLTFLRPPKHGGSWTYSPQEAADAALAWFAARQPAPVDAERLGALLRARIRRAGTGQWCDGYRAAAADIDRWLTDGPSAHEVARVARDAEVLRG